MNDGANKFLTILRTQGLKAYLAACSREASELSGLDDVIASRLSANAQRLDRSAQIDNEIAMARVRQENVGGSLRDSIRWVRRMNRSAA